MTDDRFDEVQEYAAEEERLLLGEAMHLSQQAVRRVIHDLEPRLRTLRADTLSGLAGQLAAAVADIDDSWLAGLPDDQALLDELREMRQRLDAITASLADRRSTIH